MFLEGMFVGGMLVALFVVVIGGGVLIGLRIAQTGAKSYPIYEPIVLPLPMPEGIPYYPIVDDPQPEPNWEEDESLLDYVDGENTIDPSTGFDYWPETPITRITNPKSSRLDWFPKEEN
jgi:hypothetical protein